MNFAQVFLIYFHSYFFCFACVLGAVEGPGNCTAAARRIYQQRFLALGTRARAEAGHSEPLPESDEPRDPTAEPRLKTPVKQTIYWMFDEMDVAPMDRKLSRSEAASMLNLAASAIQPAGCAQTQWAYCDYNSDDYISLSEWCWCTGLDSSKIKESKPFEVCVL